MSAFTNRKSLIIIGTTILIFIAVSLFATKPLVSSSIVAYKGWSDEKNKLARLQEKRDELAKLQKDESDINQISQTALSYLPKDADEGDFVIQTEAIAGIGGQKINSVSIVKEKAATTAPTEEDTTSTNKAGSETATGETTSKTSTQSSTQMQSLKFTLDLIGGDFVGIVNFMRDLERTDRASAVENISLSSSEETGMSAKLDGLIYYKEKISIAGTDTYKIDEKVKSIFRSLIHFGNSIDLNREPVNGRYNPFQ
jgi:hypothetical protein